MPSARTRDIEIGFWWPDFAITTVSSVGVVAT